MRSSAIRSLASVIFDSTYWPAMYPTPTTPNPTAKPVRFRRSHFLVADIILFASPRLVAQADLKQGEKRELATAFKQAFGV